MLYTENMTEYEINAMDSWAAQHDWYLHSAIKDGRLVFKVNCYTKGFVYIDASEIEAWAGY